MGNHHLNTDDFRSCDAVCHDSSAGFLLDQVAKEKSLSQTIGIKKHLTFIELYA